MSSAGDLQYTVVLCKQHIARKISPSSSPPSYIPVLMAQARIYWDREDYSQVEKIFRKSVEFCSEDDTWKLNVAHVLFMQVRKLQYQYSSIEPGLCRCVHVCSCACNEKTTCMARRCTSWFYNIVVLFLWF